MREVEHHTANAGKRFGEFREVGVDPYGFGGPICEPAAQDREGGIRHAKRIAVLHLPAHFKLVLQEMEAGVLDLPDQIGRFLEG